MDFSSCVIWIDFYKYSHNFKRNVSDLISSSEVDAIEVYDNKRSKQITWIIPLLMNAVNLDDFLANKITITIIRNIADEWNKLLIHSTHISC